MDSPLLQVLLGALAGVLSGMGVGGGAILMVAFSLFGSLPQPTAQGINLLFFLPTAATALVIHLREKRVDLRCALWAALLGGLSAAAASWLMRGADPALLKKLLGGLLLAVGLRELFFRKEAEGKKGS